MDSYTTSKLARLIEYLVKEKGLDWISISTSYWNSIICFISHTKCNTIIIHVKWLELLKDKIEAPDL